MDESHLQTRRFPHEYLSARELVEGYLAIFWGESRRTRFSAI